LAAAPVAKAGLIADTAVALPKVFYSRGNSSTASAGRPSAAIGGLNAAPVVMSVISARRNRSVQKLSKLSARTNAGAPFLLKRRCRGAIGGHREDQGIWGKQGSQVRRRQATKHV